MIDQLLDISKSFRGLLHERVKGLPSGCRGALISVDPFWIEAYKYNVAMRWPEGPYWATSDPRWSVFGEYSFDLNYRPKGWAEHCKLVGLSETSPVFFIVIPRDPEDLKHASDLPREVEGYSIIYKYYPRCEGLSWLSDKVSRPLANFFDRFRSVSELSIGRSKPDTAGTLGGILRSPVTNRLYIVSCAHVLGPDMTEVFRPGPYRGKNPTRVAHVRFSQLAEPTPQDTPCHPDFIQNPGRLDVAVAEVFVEPSQFLNLVAATRAKHVRDFKHMRLHDEVYFVGKESGLVQAQIEHLVVWDEVEIDGERRCFKDVFTLTFPDPWYLNEEISKRGDSGAWVLSRVGNSVAWDGVLFAGKGHKAYACFAQYILDESRQTFPDGLALFP